jgi:hypothetical protein
LVKQNKQAGHVIATNAVVILWIVVHELQQQLVYYVLAFHALIQTF